MKTKAGRDTQEAERRIAQGDLAKWLFKAGELVGEAEAWLILRQLIVVKDRLSELRTHLAAMPAQDVNAELLRLLWLALPMIREMHFREHPYPERCQPSSAAVSPACAYSDARAAIAQAEQARGQ